MEAEPLDREALVKRMKTGSKPRFLLFWGHTSPPNAPVGKACLSQWFLAPFVLEGKSYPTAEHYMMEQKALLFEDHQAATRILSSAHPGKAKELGRHVRGFDEITWEKERFRIVAEGSYGKFSQNPILFAFLLGTQGRVLVEASPKDTIWGIGLAEKDPRALDPNRWRGLNLLGFALMHARARLLTERAPAEGSA